MKSWMVSLPIFGRATVFVQAESEEAAKAAALDGKWEGDEIEEWEIAEECRGNVCAFSDRSVLVILNE